MKTLWYAEARQHDIARWTAAALINQAAIEHAAAVKPPVSAAQGVSSSRPPATATAPVTFGSGTCEQLLVKYFGDVLAWAQRITQRESHCSAAVNWGEGCDTSGRTVSHAEGPWQICWPQHYAAGVAVGCTDPLNLECNMKIARYLYNIEGAGPWGG